MRNSDILQQFKINMVAEKVEKQAKKHERRLQNHENVEMPLRLSNGEVTCCLKRTKPLDLTLSK